MRPRVLFVGRQRLSLPLSRSQAKKWDALRSHLEVRVLASGTRSTDRGDGTFRLIHPRSPRWSDGAAFYGGLPLRVAREIRAFGPDAVIAQSPYEGAACLSGRALAGRPTAIIVEAHGDWRTFTRLYGPPLRRLAGGVADRIAAAALTRADAVRTISGFTSGLVRDLGIEPAAEFPTFTDVEAFLRPPPEPLPEVPAFVFVGVLERYKNVDGLARAWRSAARRLPGVRLTIVGDGSLRPVVLSLLEDLPDETSWKRNLTAGQVAAELDAATALVLPSRSEGLGRVVIEALARHRPVVATSVGGITDVLADDVQSILVPPGDDEALAEALVRLATDSTLAERLAGSARRTADPWLASPEVYAQRVEALVRSVIARPDGRSEAGIAQRRA
jgi:glycosyltransferase involved in cell wall biosynthesis